MSHLRIFNAGEEPVIPERGSIPVYPGERDGTLDDLDAALVAHRMAIFKHGGRLVHLCRSVIDVRGGEWIEDQTIAEIGPDALIEYAEAAALFVRPDARAKDGYRRISCPRDLATAYLARGRWGVRPLIGIVTAPTLRPDGSLLAESGYDPATGLLYLPPAGADFSAMPSEPDQIDAIEAIGVLNELIGKFPFTSREARSVALAALITGVFRRSLPTAPLFAFTAPVAGSGKGLLCNTIGVITSGRKPSPINEAGPEEMEKRLGALLLRGDPLVCIDNITAPLGGNLLCTVLTEETPSIRVLGTSQAPRLHTNVLFLANGNNLTLLADVCRRVLTCALDPQCEFPEQREFDFDPVKRALDNRGRYLCACLTIVRAYLLAGSPRQDTPAFGSYGEWSRLVRDALVWCGEADPCATIAANRASDPDREAIGTVFCGWADVIGDEPITVKDAIEKAEAAQTKGKPGLIDAFITVAAPQRAGGMRVDPRVLGVWLRGKANRIVDGYRLTQATRRDGYRRWRLEKVGGV